MNKINIIYRLVMCFFIQAFVFTNACFALGDIFNNKTERDFLAPALQLNNDQLYSILQLYRDSKHSGIKRHKENGKYKELLERLKKQVGTADELLEKIKNKYKDEFGKAIKILEAKEQQYKIHNEDWVIEHQKEVMLMTYCMGMILGFNEHELMKLAFGARFHDIGKCEIDSLIINDDHFFPDLLFNNGEKKYPWDQINKHPKRSYDILRIAGIKDELILSIAYYHHANVDGTGYPEPVTRQEIPLGAKIVRVVDSFSAMLSKRPYPRPFQQSFDEAVQEITKNIYRYYGPRVVKTFQSLLNNEKIINRRDEFYYIPIIEGGIFRKLLKEANKAEFAYPFAKVACGISNGWNEKPFCTATNSIGTHRHAEINLVLKVLDEHSKKMGLRKNYIKQLRRLEFLAYATKLDSSEEAINIIKQIIKNVGNPFKGKVLYVTLRPCGACLNFLALLGIKQIYYAFEHSEPSFIKDSEKAVRELRKKGIIIARTYFQNEGILEPNDLFFSLLRKPGYEELADTINSWVTEIIKYNDKQEISINVMRQKELWFMEMMNKLLGNLNAQSDLELVNKRIINMKNIMMNKACSKYDVFKNKDVLIKAI